MNVAYQLFTGMVLWGSGVPSPVGGSWLRQAASDTLDLPLVEMKAPRPGKTMAVILSGDGDWATLDRTIAGVFNREGISVVGLKSRAYLKGATRTPENAGRDLSRVVQHYLERWQADTVLLVGYSRGADIGPFMWSRLPEELQTKIGVLALLSPAKAANFQFHFSDLFSDKSRPTDLPLLPEVEKLRGHRILCVYGTDEAEHSLCPDAPVGLMKVVAKPGGHHLDKDYEALGELILATWREGTPAATERSR